MTARFGVKNGNPGNFKASLHADNGSGRPRTTKIVDLGGSAPDTETNYTYTCPDDNSGCDLSASTTYHLVFSAGRGNQSGNHFYQWQTTNSDNETQTPDNNGWSIANDGHDKILSVWFPAKSGLFSVSAVKPTLAAGSATVTSLTLIIANYLGSWYYKYTTPSGGQCSGVNSSTGAIAMNLNSGTSYIFEAYSDSTCETKLATATAASTLKTLTASSVETTATLTIANHTTAWRYKYTKPTATAGTGSGALTLSSSSVTGNGALIKWLYSTDDGTSWSNIPSTSATLSYIVTALTNGTSYTFKVRAVNAAGPGLASDASDSATPVAATLSAGVATTSLKLTIANWSENWYYKYTTPTGGQCSSTISGATAIATGLASNTSYTFKAYSDSSCSMALATAAATSTLVAATLSATGMTHDSATLTIANYSGSWYYKGDYDL